MSKAFLNHLSVSSSAEMRQLLKCASWRVQLFHGAGDVSSTRGLSPRSHLGGLDGCTRRLVRVSTGQFESSQFWPLIIRPDTFAFLRVKRQA